MAKEEVLIKIKVDDKQAEKSLKDIEKDVNGVDKSLKNVGKTVEKGTISKGLNDASGAASALGGSMGAAVNGVKSLGMAFKALLANPIVLVIAGIVAGVTALFKAFTSTKKGAEQLDAVMAGVGATLDVFRDILVEVGEALVNAFSNPKKAIIDFGKSLQEFVISRVNKLMDGIGLLGSAIKKVFEGDFSGALDDAAEGSLKLLQATNPLAMAVEVLADKVKEATDEIIKETKAAYDLSLQLAELRDVERELSKERADANRLLAEARLIAADESKSAEERIIALEKINKIEADLLAKEIALAQAKYDNIVATNALSDSSEEALNKEAEAYIRIQNLQTASFNKQKGNERELTRLRNQKAAEEKRVIDEKIKNEESFFKKLEELDAKAEKDRKEKVAKQKEEEAKELERKEEQRIEDIETAKEQATELTNQVAGAIFEANAANIAREKAQKLNAVQETQNREIEIINEKLERGLINEQQAAQAREEIEKESAKKQKEIEKKAFNDKKKQDVSQALMNGALAVTKTFAQLGFVGGAIAAAGLAASTALQVATIKSQKFAKGGILEGASHANGGIDMGNNQEAEGGEAIINKRSTAMFREELSMINQAGGGVKFARGGVLSGGSSSVEGGSTMTAQLDRLIELSERPTRAVVSETEITDSQNRINNIENRSSF